MPVTLFSWFSGLSINEKGDMQLELGLNILSSLTVLGKICLYVYLPMCLHLAMYRYVYFWNPHLALLGCFY